jgi:EmrB/QacA subfamily drug resistance transporter
MTRNQPKESAMTGKRTATWTFVITSIAAFMAMLDNLVVTMALPVIREDLGASLESLEWTVNAYTLTFAVFLLTGAALGDRFGRRRMFTAGLGIFTLASAAAALAPTVEALVAARAIQGAGGALLMPLSLTLLAAAFPAEKRGVAIGAWGGIGGLAIALGPLVGGAVVEGADWQWIFWLNVPIGLAVIPFAARRLNESYGPSGQLDLPGLALASTGLFAIVIALVRGNGAGWASPAIVGSLAAGLALLAGFLAWERRAPAPMLPLRFFRNRTFTATGVVSLRFSFTMFGGAFLLSQFLQAAQGYSPLEACVRTLPWTAMPIFVAPIAGMLSDRIGGRPLMATGLTLFTGAFAMMAALITSGVGYGTIAVAFVIAGIGGSLVFAPLSNTVLGSVRPEEQGQVSGANNAIRELGGVFGVAVLASVFASRGGYGSPETFVAGLTPALWVGAGAVAVAVVAAFALPRARHSREAAAGETTLATEGLAAA